LLAAAGKMPCRPADAAALGKTTAGAALDRIVRIACAGVQAGSCVKPAYFYGNAIWRIIRLFAAATRGGSLRGVFPAAFGVSYVSRH
jgi:hypothetical protein